jgi:hypothetical protein
MHAIAIGGFAAAVPIKPVLPLTVWASPTVDPIRFVVHVAVSLSRAVAYARFGVAAPARPQVKSEGPGVQVSETFGPSAGRF